MNKKNKQFKKIKKLMIDKDVKPSMIADKAGVTRGAITRLLKGDLESERLKQVIAKMLGKKVEDLWPKGKAA
ncbi:MAG: hypothetical protein C4560_02885 [Nitrospiraceae bacterium]|nr:MAG: hypothetical protein C4560_02885 [Nitrospiraceae bacterium]